MRESAYTPIKKLVGEKTPRNFEAVKRAVDKAAAQAVERKRRGGGEIEGGIDIYENGICRHRTSYEVCDCNTNRIYNKR